VIDLGVLGQDTVPAPRRSPGWRRLSRPPRSLVVVLALAATLLGVAGAQAPGATGLTELSSVPALGGAQYAVEGDSLYVVEAAPTGNRVSAYRLRDGALRWSTPVTVLASLASFQAAAGVVLISMYAPGVSGDHTVALDERTGQVLWRSAEVIDVVLQSRQRVLLTVPDTSGQVAVGAPDQQPATRVDAVDLRDGRAAWTYRMAPGCQHLSGTDVAATDGAGPGGGATMTVLCLDRVDPVETNPDSTAMGELRSVDLMTGRDLRSAPLTYPLARAPDPLAELHPDTAPPLEPVLGRAAGVVLIGTASPSGATLTAYDPDTLRPLWTRQMSDYDYGATACAGALCLTDGYGLAVVDPGTGRLRWQIAQRAYAQPLGRLLGQLLVQPVAGQHAMLVDVGTGRRVVDLSGWRAVAAGADSPTIFARWLPVADGRVWFATVDGDPLAVRPIGAATDVLQDGCRADGGYLVCETLHQDLRVWRYRG
jgi:outer membrane protein assembly factor BamB